MTRKGYILRGALYASIAMLEAGAHYLPSPYKETAIVVGVGLVSVRAFIDTSPADARAAQEKADADAANSDLPGGPISLRGAAAN